MRSSGQVGRPGRPTPPADQKRQRYGTIGTYRLVDILLGKPLTPRGARGQARGRNRTPLAARDRRTYNRAHWTVEGGTYGNPIDPDIARYRHPRAGTGGLSRNHGRGPGCGRPVACPDRGRGPVEG